MMWLLGFITGAAAVAACVMATDHRSARRAHAEYLREWQRANNGWAIIRTRHRRANRHKEAAPLPLDIAGYQMQQHGMCRMTRKGGEWKC